MESCICWMPQGASRSKWIHKSGIQSTPDPPAYDSERMHNNIMFVMILLSTCWLGIMSELRETAFSSSTN